MRDMRAVSADEFNTFVSANADRLTTSLVGGTQCYLDSTSSEGWPENLVASFLVANGARRRATGWRIAVSTETEQGATDGEEEG